MISAPADSYALILSKVLSILEKIEGAPNDYTPLPQIEGRRVPHSTSLFRESI